MQTVPIHCLYAPLHLSSSLFDPTRRPANMQVPLHCSQSHEVVARDASHHVLPTSLSTPIHKEECFRCSEARPTGPVSSHPYAVMLVLILSTICAPVVPDARYVRLVFAAKKKNRRL